MTNPFASLIPKKKVPASPSRPAPAVPVMGPFPKRPTLSSDTTVLPKGYPRPSGTIESMPVDTYDPVSTNPKKAPRTIPKAKAVKNPFLTT